MGKSLHETLGSLAGFGHWRRDRLDFAEEEKMPELIEKKEGREIFVAGGGRQVRQPVYYMGCLLVSGLDTSGLWVWPLFSVLCFGTAMLLSKVPTGGFWYLAGKIAAGLRLCFSWHFFCLRSVWSGA